MNRESVLYRRLDDSSFTGRHGKLYTVIILGHLFDGFDINMIGFVLAGVVATFGLKSSQAGFLASSAFLGMAVGSAVIGPLVDKVGRKRGLIIAIIIYAIFSLLCAFAHSYASLLLFRILEGVGLGAEIPVVFTYLGEFMPTAYRSRMLASSVFFWQAASVIAALVAIVLVPHFGWRAMFVAGVIPAIVVLLIWSLVPESVRFLIQRGRLEDAERIVDSISTVSAAEVSVAADTPSVPHKVSTRRIFAGNYGRLTTGVWIMQFVGGFVFFGLATWLPSIFTKMGFSFVHSLAYTAVITGSGAIGNVVGGLLSDKLGTRRTLTTFFLLGGIFLMLWGTAHTPGTMMLIGILAAFFGFGGAGGVLFAYTSALYPTTVRATGTGWAALWQRMGGIVAPYLLGVLIGLHVSAYIFFLLLGMLMLVGTAAAIWLTHELSNKSLEQIDSEISM
ncbi:MFS transporter [Alicyclobacillus dauci]|uniref:MFS transporter n=1 Tax=Alicyclobacillus dauci TaxID=1475485 RepID=A0ABY6Z0M1_9BACL|nr:MFS transporter [Alicyclobacillus dauci]WAH35916.1 MFS transporter [Alicyclobacillus dauci]